MTKHEGGLDFDLNEPPCCSETNVEGQCEAERGNHGNPNGASSSTSSSRHIGINLNEPPLPLSDSEHPNGISSLSLCIDLNRLPYEYETPCPWLSLSLTCYNIHEATPNPNPQSSPSRKRSLVEERTRDTGGNKKEKKARREVGERSPPPTPAWLVQVMGFMEEAEDARLILKKTLYDSDVKKEQSRFLITFKQLERNDFLTEEESIFLEQDKVEKGKGMEVVVVNQRSEKWSLRFKKWKMVNKKKKGSLNYVLNRGWNEIVKGNALKTDDKIHLWSFRSKGSLCFALGIE